jgi:hypothetical protein
MPGDMKPSPAPSFFTAASASHLLSTYTSQCRLCPSLRPSPSWVLRVRAIRLGLLTNHPCLRNYSMVAHIIRLFCVQLRPRPLGRRLAWPALWCAGEAAVVGWDRCKLASTCSQPATARLGAMGLEREQPHPRDRLQIGGARLSLVPHTPQGFSKNRNHDQPSLRATPRTVSAGTPRAASSTRQPKQLSARTMFQAAGGA